MLRPIVIVVAAHFLFVAGALGQSETVRVRGVGGLINHQLRNIGHSVIEIQRLAQEREQNILKLRAALEQCGQCAQRSQIEAELSYWTTTDTIISELEGAELASRGLGQFKSFRHMFRELRNLADSPEYWERYRQQKQKEHLLSRAKASLRSICDRQALRKRTEVNEAERVAKRWPLVPYAGETFVRDADAYSSCEQRTVTDSNAALYAAQHELAVSFCEKLRQPAYLHFGKKGIMLEPEENSRFQKACIRLNSPIDAEWFISRMYGSDDQRRFEMRVLVRDSCTAIGQSSRDCLNKAKEDAALVAQQDRAFAHCGKEFAPTGQGSTLFGYFECLRERDPEYAMVRDLVKMRR